MKVFDKVENIIAKPKVFKSKLGIDEKTLKALRREELNENINKILEGAGAFWKGILIVNALRALGIGAAVVAPWGWAVVAAAGVIMAAGQLGINWLARDGRVERSMIRTPLDALAVGLFNFFAPLGLKVASLAGNIAEYEQQYIVDYFVDEWGYSKEFVELEVIKLERNSDKIETLPIVEIVDSIIKYKSDNPGCDLDSMSRELVQFLKGVTRADGQLRNQEVIYIQWLEINLTRSNPESWHGLRSAIRPNENGIGGYQADADFKGKPRGTGEPSGNSKVSNVGGHDAHDSTWADRKFWRGFHWARRLN